MFCFGIVFNCFEISQAVCADAFTSEYFAASKGNFYKLKVHEKQTSGRGDSCFCDENHFKNCKFLEGRNYISSLLDFQSLLQSPGIKRKLEMLTGWNRMDESSIHFTPCLCYSTLQFPLILQHILMEVSTLSGIYADDRTNTRSTQ